MIAKPLRSTSDQRCGSALLLVLIVVMLLSFSCYSFVNLMVTELQATKSAVSQVQMKRLADSGIAAAMALQADPDSSVSAQQALSNVLVAAVDGRQLRYTVVKSDDALTGGAFQPGLQNESGKLNLNALPLTPQTRIESRNRLMVLPGMTVDTADAILDWMDEDDEPSQYGAESSHYLSLTAAYAPRQGRLATLSELLLVRGVTPQLLYGVDGHSGWSQWITLTAWETTLQPNGQPKIPLNSADLESLYEQLVSAFDPEFARFVVAYRIAGNAHGSQAKQAALRQLSSRERAEVRRQQRLQSARERLDAQLGKSPSRRSLTGTESPRTGTQRGGLDLNRQPAHRIRSVVDLIGTTVRMTLDGRDTVLESPFPNDSASLDQTLFELESRLTVAEGATHVGRINVNTAAAVVLQSVPGLSDGLAESIVLARANHGRLARSRRTLAWLVTENLVDLDQLRVIAPQLTTGGDVISGCAIGHVDGRTAAYAVRFVAEATPHQSRILRLIDHGPVPFSLEQ